MENLEDTIEVDIDYPTLIRYSNYEYLYDLMFDLKMQEVEIQSFDDQRSSITILFPDFFSIDDDVEAILPLPKKLVDDAKEYIRKIVLSFPEMTNSIGKYL